MKRSLLLHSECTMYNGLCASAAAAATTTIAAATAAALGKTVSSLGLHVYLRSRSYWSWLMVEFSHFPCNENGTALRMYVVHIAYIALA